MKNFCKILSGSWLEFIESFYDSHLQGIKFSIRIVIADLYGSISYHVAGVLLWCSPIEIVNCVHGYSKFSMTSIMTSWPRPYKSFQHKNSNPFWSSTAICQYANKPSTYTINTDRKFSWLSKFSLPIGFCRPNLSIFACEVIWIVWNWFEHDITENKSASFIGAYSNTLMFDPNPEAYLQIS